MLLHVECFPGGTPFSGLYGGAPLERDVFFKLAVY